MYSRLDALFAEWHRPSAPGAAAAVVQDGEVVYAKGYGCANVEYGVGIAPSTVFDIASVSKQFGAYAIALLEDEGWLALDDDYRDRLPDMPDFGPTVTLRHLLHHTSGIRDWVPAMVMAGVRMDDTILFEDILRFARRQRDLNFAPGEQHLYSNTGYNLLAETVARVSGMSFRQFTHERIFGPLGMTSTHFHDDHREVIPGRAMSYEPDDSAAFVNATDNLTALASSSLHSTVEDLARWAVNLDTGAVGPVAALARMNAPGAAMGGANSTYGFGQVTDTYRGRPILHHSGSWRGFRSHLSRFPEERFAVVLLSNAATFRAGPLAREIADVFLESRLGPPPATRDVPTEAPDAPVAIADGAALPEYAGSYYSQELDTTYTIAVDDRGLYAAHARHEDIRLTSLADDTFAGDEWFFGEARFTRAGGDVDGFLLSVERVRNVRFARRS
ncbi:beta-lactamase family protein [Candidatus Poribacteria bacterium]|nr:beta-lactamase family protein [Candidatus Poribacteria bacterium]MBT5535817.1 beta-lactamase family protein [Candidatus Poribacteria bacterium]MBT7808020.1 beta-lactamase family protein [Candidatus Poribacteria bacterium]